MRGKKNDQQFHFQSIICYSVTWNSLLFVILKKDVRILNKGRVFFCVMTTDFKKLYICEPIMSLIPPVIRRLQSQWNRDVRNSRRHSRRDRSLYQRRQLKVKNSSMRSWKCLRTTSKGLSLISMTSIRHWVSSDVWSQWPQTDTEWVVMSDLNDLKQTLSE